MNFNLKNLAFLSFFTTALFLTSCETNTENNTADTDNYDKFVTRLESERANWDTDTAYWTTVERDYEPMRTEIDANYESMDEEERKRVDEIRTRYDRVRGEYMTAREQRATANNANRETELRTMIFGADATADLSNVTGENIRSYYEKLVNTVRENGDSYSPADWDAIKAWYEKLDARKNDFEGKTLSSADNLAIAKLKVEYVSIAKTGRIGSKIDEKVDEQTDDVDAGKN